MLGIHIREPSVRAPMAEQKLSPLHVVALRAEGAPCGLIFFDGTERWIEADGMGMILPGGAFFAAEALIFTSPAEAHAQALRLNEAGPTLDHPWRALPLKELDGAEGQDDPPPRRSRAALRSRR